MEGKRAEGKTCTDYTFSAITEGAEESAIYHRKLYKNDCSKKLPSNAAHICIQINQFCLFIFYYLMSVGLTRVWSLYIKNEAFQGKFDISKMVLKSRFLI